MKSDYISMIDKMLAKITSEQKLKRIYDYICFVYLKSND